MISPAPRCSSSLGCRARSRRGLSVVELLAATVISLIVMGATVQLFGTVGNQITYGRSNIEQGDRLRGAIERLRKDLRGVTVDMRAWNRPEDASGYFEIVKGPSSAWDKGVSGPVANPNSSPGASLGGYTADGLFFTTRSRDVPFVGRAGQSGGTVESQVAEVAWYLQPTNMAATSGTGATVYTNPKTYTLYRRLMLVLPGINSSIATGSPPSITSSQYLDPNSVGVPVYDLSAHQSGTGSSAVWILNSLADLSYRENRFAHTVGSFPYSINATTLQAFPYSASDPYTRYGEDVVLTNVLSFDVKVWDPGTPVLQDGSGNPLVPSDYGYSSGKAMTSPVYGAYVDLNWNGSPYTGNPSGAPPSYFGGSYYGSGANSGVSAGSSASQFPMANSATYDTWSAGYEVWNPGTTSSNQSCNGFDDTPSGKTDGGVDNPNERITSPPYPAPIRGIQIKIRTYEFTSKQVREATIQENFAPD